MYDFLLFLHVIGAVGLGFYLILPFLVRRTKSLSGHSLESYLGGLYGTSRLMQYLLIAQLLTGGYLMSKFDYSISWMVFAIGFFVLVAAISGMMNVKMKKAIKDLKGGGTGEDLVASVRTFSYIVSVSLLVVLYLMVYPMYA